MINLFLTFLQKINISLFNFFLILLGFPLIMLIPKNEIKKYQYIFKNQFGLFALLSSLCSMPILYLFFKLFDYYIITRNNTVLFLIPHGYKSIFINGLMITYLHYLLTLNIVLILKRLNIYELDYKFKNVAKCFFTFIICLAPIFLGIFFSFKDYSYVTKDTITFTYKKMNIIKVIKYQNTYLINDIRQIAYQPNSIKYTCGGRGCPPNSYEVFDSYKITFNDGFTFDTQNDSSPYFKYNFNSDEHELIKKGLLENKEKEYRLIKYLSEKSKIPIQNEGSIFLIPQNAFN